MKDLIPGIDVNPCGLCGHEADFDLCFIDGLDVYQARVVCSNQAVHVENSVIIVDSTAQGATNGVIAKWNKRNPNE